MVSKPWINFSTQVLIIIFLFFTLYRPSSWPIALRNVLKCSTWHTFFTIRFWHFSSAAFIEKNAERVPMLVIIMMTLYGDCPKPDINLNVFWQTRTIEIQIVIFLTNL